MPRWALLLIAVVAVVCAGIGTSLVLARNGDASFGWIAYAPLSPSDNGRYLPVDPTWLEWRAGVGAALLALGAGGTGAVLAGTVASRARKRDRAAA